MRSSSNLQPLDVLVALVAILTAVLVVGFTGAPSGAATEPTISVSNALLLLSDEPLLVQGRLIAPSGRARLCESLRAQPPLRCKGGSLRVVGLDPYWLGRLAESRVAKRVILPGVIGPGVLDLHSDLGPRA